MRKLVIAKNATTTNRRKSMNLPYSEQLDIGHFGRFFDNTSECYKFFWFKAILSKISEGKTEYTYEELVDEMIAEAWYMVSEYHLNLGPRDNLEQTVKRMNEITNLKSAEKKSNILEYLKNCEDKEIKQKKNIGKMNTNKNEMKKEVDLIIAELLRFSPHLLEINNPVLEEEIARFESKFNLPLPEDYKYLLSITNGFSLMGDEVLGIAKNKYDLVNAYQFEHYEVINPQYEYLIPFSPDGFGNSYCFDTRIKTNQGFSNQIVFWQHDYEYSETDLPEITNNSLIDFINNWIIGNTLKYYDYEGNEKL